MVRVLLVSLFALVWGLAIAGDSAKSSGGVSRSDLFVFTAGDQIEDSGQLLVTGGRQTIEL